MLETIPEGPVLWASQVPSATPHWVKIVILYITFQNKEDKVMVVLVWPKYSLSCILCNEGAPDCDHTTAQVVCTKCSHLEYYNRIQHWESDPCERMCKRKMFRENKEHVHNYTADQSSLLWSWTLKGLPLRKLLSGVWVITITLSNNLQKESWVIPDLFTEILTDICVHGYKNI